MGQTISNVLAKSHYKFTSSSGSSVLLLKSPVPRSSLTDSSQTDLTVLYVALQLCGKRNLSRKTWNRSLSSCSEASPFHHDWSRGWQHVPRVLAASGWISEWPPVRKITLRVCKPPRSKWLHLGESQCVFHVWCLRHWQVNASEDYTTQKWHDKIKLWST